RPVVTWTIATDRSMLEGIREEMSGTWAKILFVGLWLGALAFQAGNFTGSALALEYLAPNLPIWFWVALLSLIALVITWIGVYKLMENINRTFVVLLVLAFVITALTAIPDAGGFVTEGFSF